jgi:hypothetical protein
MRGSNGSPSSTDSRSEQRSVVVGSRLPTDAPNGLSQTRVRRCARSRLRPVSGSSRSLDSSPLRWAGLGLMLELTVGVARASTVVASGEQKVAVEHSPVGATAELGATRATPELAETAREQRASRGVTAGREGKALKAEILWVDVARNKATRPGRAQTAERVRNSESGRCR